MYVHYFKIMCSFKSERVYALFALIHEYHMEKGTDPTSDYRALRDIIADRSIVTGKSRNYVMMQNLQALRGKFPQHASFFEWFEKLYNGDDHSSNDDDTELPESIAPASSPAPEEELHNSIAPASSPTTEELHEPLLQEALSVNTPQVQQSTPVEKPRRRRWWLMFLA